jgi:hypothetical protein
MAFRLSDLAADEAYLKKCLEAKDWFNIVLFAFDDKTRMSQLRTLLKRGKYMPVPREQLTSFLAVGGLDLDVMKCFLRPKWWAALEPDTLSDLYVFNQWVSACLDLHTCEQQMHCNVFERLLVDFRPLRHYCYMRAQFLTLHLSCDLCLRYAARALIALNELSKPMFDYFTVREVRGARILCEYVPQGLDELVAAVKQKLATL